MREPSKDRDHPHRTPTNTLTECSQGCDQEDAEYVIEVEEDDEETTEEYGNEEHLTTKENARNTECRQSNQRNHAEYDQPCAKMY